MISRLGFRVYFAGCAWKLGFWDFFHDMIKLAAFDLDGTLLKPDMTISPRTRAAIARAQEKGIIVTIATGRGPIPTDKFAVELNLTAPLVCFQGGIIFDLANRTVLNETRLDPAVIPIIVKVAEERGWNLQFDTPTTVFFPRVSNHPQAMFDLHGASNWKRVDNLLTDMPEVPHKFILTVNDPKDRDSLTAELRAYFDDQTPRITVVPSHPLLIEGLPHGLNKSVGLAWLAARYGITSDEVLTVGDNDNDVEMLAWAGVGVAMGNGSAPALAAANWVAPSVLDDGAAVALERYL
jgi:Cof subfamily protein (haloacid dehalogenase superfamily)